MPAKKKTATKKTTTKRASVTARRAVKKTAAKTTKRKVASKRRTTTKVCGCKPCPEGQSFWVHNGPVVDSIPALKTAVKKMSVAQYRYHTTRNGNDFAKWIRGSLSCESCARKVERARTKQGLVKVLDTACARA